MYDKRMEFKKDETLIAMNTKRQETTEMKRLTIEEMRDWLEEFYKSAGFQDIREQELKHNSDEEILQLYHSWQ